MERVSEHPVGAACSAGHDLAGVDTLHSVEDFTFASAGSAFVGADGQISDNDGEGLACAVLDCAVEGI